MKRGIMFYKIFIPILMLGVLLVISFGSYIYMNTNNSLIERVANSKQSFISQAKNTLEQKIRTIEYAFNTYSTTSSFSQVVNQPITERDFAAYRDVNSQLNYIATMGIEDAQYTLISLVQSWQISNGRLTHLKPSDIDQLKKTYVEGQSNGLFWVKTTDGIRFVNTLPVFSQSKRAIALSDISLQTLNRTLESDENAVIIFNSQGQLMYNSDQLLHLPQDARLQSAANWEGKDQRMGMTDLGQDGYPDIRAIYSKSSYNGWVYVTLLDPQEISSALKTTRYGLILMGLVTTFLIVIVAWVIALYFTKPIRKIQRSLPVMSPATASNEIDWIISSIDMILTEKQSLERLMEEEMPELETQFILNLFRSRVNREELNHGLERFGYTLNDQSVFASMLIQLDNYGDLTSSDKDVLLLAVNKLVEEVVPPERRMIPILLNDRMQATILMYNGASEQDMRRQMLEDAKSVIRSAREYLKLSVSIGFSRPYHDLLRSKEACEMSKQALHHRLHLGKESIIFYDDITTVVQGKVMLQYPAELETQLFDAIRQGDEEQVSRTMYPLLGSLMKHSHHPMNFEVMLIRFVNNLISLEQIFGGDVLLSPDHSMLYHRLLDIRNPEEIERILVEEVIQPMVKSMKEKTTEQFRSLSDQIAAIVRAEYDQDLSLELIGDRLHYNPSYLSSIFKKEFGTTFSDYLMSYRLDMAKRWLIETNMTIKDIAERLQYQNPQNFIRSFRKKEQVTPGTYRKLNQAL
ncbi:helix-turn-helix transcriptional regulator [Paenibacillus sp. JX-17]|uniref:Helix-turn-helix transcriptional regulator n=1 Tax=Paenibacillus lacisoli TaxID=3064525 RepID=A0ABT9CA69_9BACL|nr:helix-turn-helix transcriptional regulator [Paenibacillus sp. JX-17]MDO7905544.1 helix-turn-helix transcriptional regulator [Paenibacillus sp. JX-17]